MNPHFWWYVARASGMTASILVTLSVIWGLLLTTRLVQGRSRPAWVLDLHRFLGGLSVLFTALHLFGLVGDNYLHFDLGDLSIPMASSWKPGAVAWGIASMYLLFAIEVTSLMMRHLPRTIWRQIHRTSFLLFLMVVVHGFAAGTDHANPVFLAVSAVGVATVVFMTALLIIGGAGSGPNRRPRISSSSAVQG